MKRILVTGTGGAASKALVRCLNKSPNLEIYGTDSNELNINFSEAKETFLVSHSSDEENYIKDLVFIINTYKIDFLWPHHDVELFAVTKHIDKIPCKTFLPDHNIINLCQDKTKLIEFLKEDVPKVYEHILTPLREPIWLRANKGVGGKGSILIKQWEQVDMWKGLNPTITDWQYSEYLPGRNIGVDIFLKDGKVINYQIKERLQYLPGQSMSGVTGSTGFAKVIYDKNILDIATKAILKLQPRISGLFAVDLKGDKNIKFKITEINAGRFLTSSFVLFHMTDFNLPVRVLNSMFPEVTNIGCDSPEIEAEIIRQVDSLPKRIK